MLESKVFSRVNVEPETSISRENRKFYLRRSDTKLKIELLNGSAIF